MFKPVRNSLIPNADRGNDNYCYRATAAIQCTAAVDMCNLSRVVFNINRRVWFTYSIPGIDVVACGGGNVKRADDARSIANSRLNHREMLFHTVFSSSDFAELNSAPRRRLRLPPKRGFLTQARTVTRVIILR